MIIIKSKREIAIMREAGLIVAACHAELAKRIRPGVTTMEINRFVDEFLRKHDTIPAQIGYKGYPYATCASLNDEICHGFPSEHPLRDGDIVTIDMVARYKELHADSAWSYAVGTPSPEAAHLLSVTQEALRLGIEQSMPGHTLGDIGHAIQTYVENQGMSVVREFIGHGIGRTMHESPPDVKHYGTPGTGHRIKPGMTFTIEPMVNLGTHRLTLDANGWTARTEDGRLSAQYEHTIAITDHGPEILTQL